LDSNQNDITLWESFLRDDAVSLGLLFKKYYPALTHYGGKLCKDMQSVEDSIQELFLELWKNKNSLPTISIKAYLLKALKYKLLKEIGRNSTESIDLLEDHAFVLSHESFIVTVQEEKAISNQLARALSQLTSRQKEVVYLKFYQQLDYDEISVIMHINYQATRNLLYQAVKSLRRSLATSLLQLRVTV
jgi:RNA polymerase sigma factor (sigma-70 family)